MKEKAVSGLRKLMIYEGIERICDTMGSKDMTRNG